MATAQYERGMVLAAGDYAIIGIRPLRHDGTDNVTRRAISGADSTTAVRLHGTNLRGADAPIKSLDAGRAESLPSVQAAVTNKYLAATQPNETADCGLGGGLGEGKVTQWASQSPARQLVRASRQRRKLST